MQIKLIKTCIILYKYITFFLSFLGELLQKKKIKKNDFKYTRAVFANIMRKKVLSLKKKLF